MSAGEITVLLAAVLVAATTQMVAGFGFALLAVPLMSTALDTHLAVVVTTALGLVTSAAQAWNGRRDTERVLAKRMTLAAFAGMPFGLLVFTQVNERVLRLLLGVCVLVVVVLLARRIDLRHAGPRLDWTAGAISGALSTSLSTNGPPLVFALQARHLSPHVFRPTINTVFAVSGVVTLSAFAIAGEVEAETLRAVALSIPALLAGLGLGISLRGHVDGERFRGLVLVLLSVAALGAIVAAVA